MPEQEQERVHEHQPVAEFKIVLSTPRYPLPNLRGPEGRGERKCIIDAGFADGDDVVLIRRSYYDALCGGERS